MMSGFKALGLVIFVMLPGAVYAVDSCQAVFETPAPITVESVLEFTNTIGQVNFGGSRVLSAPLTAAKIAEKEESFNKRWTELKDLMGNEDAASAQALVEHHQKFISAYKDPVQLKKLQSEALKKDLKGRGASIDESLSGQLNLARISQQNLKRVIEKHQWDESYKQDKDIVRVTENLQLVYKHNSNIHKTHGDFLFSSQQIQSYGLDGGVNSQLPFNKQFMKNDDHLFFTLEISLKGRITSSLPSKYGTHVKTLTSEEAHQTAWVSPYVMYPQDLANFGREFLRGKYAGIEDLQVGRGTIQRYQATALADDLKSQLHNFDFTLKDFESLLRLHVGNMLWRLKTQDQRPYPGAPSYADTLASFSVENPHFQQVVEALILYPLKMGKFEMKVPVAIPQNHLIDSTQ